MYKFMVENFEFCFEDSDIVNPDDFIPGSEYNPHNVRLWLIHDHGFTVGCAFASSLGDALDELVDNDKLDSFQIDEVDYDDYGINTSNPTCAFLGNACEPFDIDPLGFIELPSPRLSITALYDSEKIKPLNSHMGI